MALSNLNKDNVNRLMESLSIIELNESKNRDLVKYSASCNTKLKLLYEQNAFIKDQVMKIIESASLNKRLHEARCNFTKVCGQTYHFYMDHENCMFCWN